MQLADAIEANADEIASIESLGESHRRGLERVRDRLTTVSTRRQRKGLWLLPWIRRRRGRCLPEVLRWMGRQEPRKGHRGRRLQVVLHPPRAHWSRWMHRESPRLLYDDALLMRASLLDPLELPHPHV